MRKSRGESIQSNTDEAAALGSAWGMVGKRHWRVAYPVSQAPGWKEQVLPAPFVFPFLCFPPLTNFGDKALFFSLFGLRCHFHFLFFVFYRHLTCLSLLWKAGRCLPRRDRGPFPVSKGSRIQEWRGQVESSQRGKSRENGIDRDRPEKSTFLKRQILKMREYKNVCMYRRKKIRLNFSQKLW